MKNIEYYNLDMEYPVNYQFWKDFSAIFLYWGFYKPIKWKGGFRRETIKRIQNAFIDADKKIKDGLSFTEYELAKDKLSHNYSSFRYYFERAEKISSFNFFQKIEWTTSEVYKNLYPRISPYNKFCIEIDFYAHAYEVIYNKILIHHYAINQFEISPIRLAFDPLLLDKDYDKKINSDILSVEYSESQLKKSYLLNCELHLSSSKALKEIFVDKKKFDKIDFALLKEYNIFYDTKFDGFTLKRRFKADLIILIVSLKNNKIVELKHQKDINMIFKDIFNVRVSENLFSEIFSKDSDSKKQSKDDIEIFNSVSKFINEYIKKL